MFLPGSILTGDRVGEEGDAAPVQVALQQLPRRGVELALFQGKPGAVYNIGRGKFTNAEYGFEGFDDFDLGGFTIAAGDVAAQRKRAAV